MWDNRLASNVEHVIGSGAPDRAIEEDAPPSVQINPHSELGKELRKWEQHMTWLTPAGTRPGNPYVYRPFPKMLYRAERASNGQTTCVLPSPSPWDYPNPEELARQQLHQEGWNKQHQRIVNSESEMLIAKGQGWAESPSDALELYEQRQIAISDEAGRVAYQAKRMSDKAQRELKQADESTDAHVLDVKPVRKRGRPAKGTKAVTAATE